MCLAKSQVSWKVSNDDNISTTGRGNQRILGSFFDQKQVLPLAILLIVVAVSYNHHWFQKVSLLYWIESCIQYFETNFVRGQIVIDHHYLVLGCTCVSAIIHSNRKHVFFQNHLMIDGSKSIRTSTSTCYHKISICVVLPHDRFLASTIYISSYYLVKFLP